MRYQGEYKNDLIEGIGIFYYNQGYKYISKFKKIIKMDMELYII